MVVLDLPVVFAIAALPIWMPAKGRGATRLSQKLWEVMPMMMKPVLSYFWLKRWLPMLLFRLPVCQGVSTGRTETWLKYVPLHFLFQFLEGRLISYINRVGFLDHGSWNRILLQHISCVLHFQAGTFDSLC